MRLIPSNQRLPLALPLRRHADGVSFGGHSQRYPLASTAEYDAMLQYPGWPALQRQLQQEPRHSVLLFNPGTAWPVVTLHRQQPKGHQQVVESDPPYRDRILHTLWQQKQEGQIPVHSGLDEVSQPADQVVAPFVLTQHTPDERPALLRQLSHENILSPQGEVLLVEPVVDYSLLHTGGRTLALLRQSANVLVDAVRHRHWETVRLEANHLLGALTRREWMPPRLADVGNLLYQQRLEVTGQEQVFPRPGEWVPFPSDKAGVFLIHAHRQPSNKAQ